MNGVVPVAQTTPIAAHAAQDEIHHYVYFNTKRERIAEPWFLASTRIEGAQLKYAWAELEGARSPLESQSIN